MAHRPDWFASKTDGLELTEMAAILHQVSIGAAEYENPGRIDDYFDAITWADANWQPSSLPYDAAVREMCRAALITSGAIL
jgi:hypothetical protein